MSVEEFLRVPPIGHFSQVVQAYETDYKETDEIYLDSISRMKKISLKSLNQMDVKSILNPFLLNWGKMARVLGFAGCIRIGRVLKEMSEELLDIRTFNLENDLERVSNVPELFDKIKDCKLASNSGYTKKVGSTAASKALHLIAPNLFVMWDNDIRKYFGFNPKGKAYQGFLADMKNWIECLGSTVTDLAQQYGKTHTKIVDEFNWYRLRCWW